MKKDNYYIIENKFGIDFFFKSLKDNNSDEVYVYNILTGKNMYFDINHKQYNIVKLTKKRFISRVQKEHTLLINEIREMQKIIIKKQGKINAINKFFDKETNE